MIHLKELGMRNYEDVIKKRFRKADLVLQKNELVITLQNEKLGRNIYGMIYLRSTGQEVGNFTMTKTLISHPHNAPIQLWGPQISWFNVYKQYRGKQIAVSVYEALIEHFGRLYSDHEQTNGGTKIWLSLAKRGNVHVELLSWEKGTLKFVDAEPFIYESDEKARKEWFNEQSEHKILVASKKPSKLDQIEVV